jgi:hypothetical protein
MEFREWLFLKEDAGAPGAKQALYPYSYGGIGLYPPSDVITWASDAITYMPDEMRILKFKWGRGMLSDPFEKDGLYNSIEGKRAEQVQGGNLRPDKTGFEKTEKYSEKFSMYTVGAGGLRRDGTGFTKEEFAKKIPKFNGVGDYKQIGEYPVASSLRYKD